MVVHLFIVFTFHTSFFLIFVSVAWLAGTYCYRI